MNTIHSVAVVLTLLLSAMLPRAEGLVANGIRTGEVVAVGEMQLVEISLGLRDGVREGDCVDVYRGRGLVGRGMIVKIVDNRAVAKLVWPGKIARGDAVVWNEPRSLAARQFRGHGVCVTGGPGDW